MRIILFAGAAMLVAALAATPVQAQNRAFMWCEAIAGNGLETTNYYSAIFSAGANQADAKARAFKSEVEEEQISAAAVAAKCMAHVDYDAAVEARDAAMKAAPGEVLTWEG
jgi:hypothetical protein